MVASHSCCSSGQYCQKHPQPFSGPGNWSPKDTKEEKRSSFLHEGRGATTLQSDQAEEHKKRVFFASLSMLCCAHEWGAMQKLHGEHHANETGSIDLAMLTCSRPRKTRFTQKNYELLYFLNLDQNRDTLEGTR